MKEVSDQAFAAVAETSGEQAEELAVGASQTIGQYLLPNFIAGFVKAHPRIRIIARSGNTVAILDALLAHDIQLALVEGPDPRKDLNTAPSLHYQMLLVLPTSQGWSD